MNPNDRPRQEMIQAIIDTLEEEHPDLIIEAGDFEFRDHDVHRLTPEVMW